MALTTFTTTNWATGMADAAAGFPTTDDLDGGTLGSGESDAQLIVGEETGLGKYLYWSGTSTASLSDFVMVADGDIATYLGANGKAVRTCYTLKFVPDSADFKSNITGGLLSGSNPDVRWTAPAGDYTGDGEADYATICSGTHFTLNPVRTGSDELPANVRIPLNRVFRIEWWIVRNGATDYDVALFIDGVCVLKIEGETSAATAGNRINELKWTGVGDGSGSTYVQIRMYGDYSGVEQFASGGWDNFLGSADPDLYRTNNNRSLAGSAFHDPKFDGHWTSDLTDITLDDSQAHDYWIATRGYNAYPERSDASSASASATFETRERNLSWPVRDGRCAMKVMHRPCNAATNAMGQKFIAIDTGDNDPLVGLGWDSATGGTSTLYLVYYDGSFQQTESTGITIDLDHAWDFVISFSEGKAGVIAIDWSISTNSSRFVWWYESQQISGIPSDGFFIRRTSESGNNVSTPNQAQFFGLWLLERVPYYIESSYNSTEGTISVAGDDDGDFRRCANVAAAGHDAAGAAGIISQIETLGTLTTDGHIQPGSKSPGFQLAMSGLSMTELVEDSLNDDPDGFAACAKACQFISTDGKVNGVKADGAAATIVSADRFYAALRTYQIEHLVGATASPDPDGNADWNTTHQSGVYTMNLHAASMKGPRWGYDLPKENGSEDAATDAYMDNTTDTLHPIDDVQWLADMFGGTLRRIPGYRSRERTRTR